MLKARYLGPIRNVCVYCASSPDCDPSFVHMTRALGRELALRGVGVVYGGGSLGLMGVLAESALEAGGRVVGVIPNFMVEREWHHTGVSESHIVESMYQRKEKMLQLADAFVALPGGIGTLEELIECLSFKRLGLIEDPVIIANWRGYYDPLLRQLDDALTGRFLPTNCRSMWKVAAGIEDLMALLRTHSDRQDARAAALTLIAKMALADGVAVSGERDLLGEMLGNPGLFRDVEQMLDVAAQTDLAALSRRLTRYEDRFLVALRVRIVAHSDGELVAAEDAFYSELLAALELGAEDQRLIERSEARIRAELPHDSADPVLAIYRRSSFAEFES
ncbi:MAG: TIGR00730 family Rossman fold protein [Planctomycetota bacterium]